MFPLEIKLKKKLPIDKFESNYQTNILSFFENEFAERQADNLVIEGNKLRFKNNIFKFVNNWNIMAPIDRGEVQIHEENINELKIQYLFSLRRTLLVSSILGVLVYLITNDWTGGLIAVLWLGGMNWLVAVIRHIIMFNDLVDKITKR